MHRILPVSLLVLLALTACGSDKPAPLPTEPITATGTLIPIQISRMIRGTHKLQVNGEDLYYVESAAISLRAYEGQIVGVHGVLNHNLNPEDLPVLRVDRVLQKPVQGMPVQLPAYKLSLTLPDGWQQVSASGGVVLTASGTPIILITKGATMPPDGISLLLGGRTALRTMDANGDESITVDTPDGFVVIKTFPKAAGTGSILSEAGAILRSMRFSAGAAQTSSVATGSGTYRQPCGGPAGILCPAGSFCAITDATTNVGLCQIFQPRNP